MIVSHRHRFIFFAVPKTATHAIREALTPYLGPDDWQQQALFGKDDSPIPELAAIGHGHLSVRDVLPRLGDDVWRDYFKFAFVRNPFDRFVSTCFFLFRDDPRFAGAATSFMKRALQRPRFRQRVLVLPQTSFLVRHDGTLAMNRVGRYEDLRASFEAICRRIGLPSETLVRKNLSQHDTYSSYYDRELADMVTTFYREDFRRFGYTPDSVVATN